LEFLSQKRLEVGGCKLREVGVEVLSQERFGVGGFKSVEVEG